MTIRRGPATWCALTTPRLPTSHPPTFVDALKVTSQMGLPLSVKPLSLSLKHLARFIFIFLSSRAFYWLTGFIERGIFSSSSSAVCSCGGCQQYHISRVSNFFSSQSRRGLLNSFNPGSLSPTTLVTLELRGYEKIMTYAYLWESLLLGLN